MMCVETLLGAGLCTLKAVGSFDGLLLSRADLETLDRLTAVCCAVLCHAYVTCTNNQPTNNRLLQPSSPRTTACLRGCTSLEETTAHRYSWVGGWLVNLFVRGLVVSEV